MEFVVENCECLEVCFSSINKSNFNGEDKSVEYHKFNMNSSQSTSTGCTRMCTPSEETYDISSDGERKDHQNSPSGSGGLPPGADYHVINDTSTSQVISTSGTTTAAAAASSCSSSNGSSSNSSCTGRDSSSPTNPAVPLTLEAFFQGLGTFGENATGSRTTNILNATDGPNSATLPGPEAASMIEEGGKQEPSDTIPPTHTERQRMKIIEFKSKRRLALNRASARRRREKKRCQLEGLQALTNTLVRTNEAIVKENKEIYAQITTLMSIVEKATKGEITAAPAPVPAPHPTCGVGNGIDTNASSGLENLPLNNFAQEEGASLMSNLDNNQVLPSTPQQPLTQLQLEQLFSSQSQQQQMSATLTFPTNKIAQEQTAEQPFAASNEQQQHLILQQHPELLQLPQQQIQEQPNEQQNLILQQHPDLLQLLQQQIQEQPLSNAMSPSQRNAPVGTYETQTQLQLQQQQRDVSHQQTSFSSSISALPNHQSLEMPQSFLEQQGFFLRSNLPSIPENSLQEGENDESKKQDLEGSFEF